MKFDDSLTDQLSRIADEPGPPTTVDLDRAVATARRTKTRRRAVGATTGTAVVAVVAALLVTVAGGGRGAPAGTPTGQPTASPSASAARPGADPLTLHARFTSLPGGFTIKEVETEVGNSQITVADAATGQSAVLGTLPFRQSPVPPLTPYGTLAPVAAPPVRLDTAYWFAAPGSTQAAENHFVQLNWEFTANRWATLRFYSADTGTAIANTVYQLANNADFSTATAYPLPLRLTPPTGLKVVSATYSLEAAGGWKITLGYDAEDASGDALGELLFTIGPGPWTGLGTATASASSTVRFAPSGSPGPHSTTVDKCPAVLDANLINGASEELSTQECNGLSIDITVYGEVAQELQQQFGGIEGFFTSITWFDSSPGDWTTDVDE